MSTTIATRAAAAATSTIFDRIVVGIDGSPESLEAARQAAKLTNGPLTFVSSYDLAQAMVGGGMVPGPVYIDEEPLRAEAEQAVEEARHEIAPTPVTAQIARGRPWVSLLDQIAAGHHTLVSVGSHGARRAKGIVIGSTATELIHKAPCSVLVARKPLKEFPSSIVVGVDESPQGAHADAVARHLAAQFSASLDRRENLRHPVEMLVEASMEADLLVIGSRGLTGVKALGSVSERVAHEAKCSVLVVR